MSLSDRASDWGYAAGWRFVRALPESVAVALFNAGADFAARKGGPDQLRRNLARVLGVPPEQVPDQVVRDSLRSYARYWREAFRLPSMDLAKVGAQVEASIAGVERVDAALAAGNGVILALPHSGNWDMAGVFAARKWGTFATVAERLEPESLFWRFVRYRETLGFEIIPERGGHVPPAKILAERLRANRVVCLLAERDLSGRGAPVTFFGERTNMAAGPARLAIETGAALLPVHCWFEPGGWGFRVAEPVDTAGGVAAATQRLADRFSDGIAAHPADWHMLQPLWFDDLSPSRRARLATAGA
ncbi:MAG: phosphatidylinositol mannoside acyltransferase [Mycobacteriaceae bacterium]|nr:phosphatidylinositol mannoside acyltransferase [Mycobacteriaceae bacterium]